jgi:hypothetical protein
MNEKEDKINISPDDIQDVTDFTEFLVEHIIDFFEGENQEVDRNIIRNVLIGTFASISVRYSKSWEELGHLVESQMIASNQLIKIINEEKEKSEKK